MNKIIISLASNYEQTQNLPLALQRLGQVLTVTRVTQAIWTKPYRSDEQKTTSDKREMMTGERETMTGERKMMSDELYLNQLVYGETTLDADQLETLFKQLERSMGRTPAERQLGIVRIDIDLLQHADTRYHQKDWDRDYIKQLLSP